MTMNEWICVYSSSTHSNDTRALKMSSKHSSRLTLIFHRSCKRLSSLSFYFLSPFHGVRAYHMKREKKWNFLIKIIVYKKDIQRCGDYMNKLASTWCCLFWMREESFKNSIDERFYFAFVFVPSTTTTTMIFFICSVSFLIFFFILGFMNEWRNNK